MRRGRFIRAKKELTDAEKKVLEKRTRKKTDNVRNLANNIHKLRSKVTKDLKSKDEKLRLTALVVALIDKTAERVGNEESAKNGHFGITGLKKKHITVDGNKITLKYTGKSGTDHEKSFSSEKLAPIIQEYKNKSKNKDGFVFETDGFKIKSDKVNRYLREFNTTAKDLRGYQANRFLYDYLKSKTIPKDEKERKKIWQEAITYTAEKVGHGKGILKKDYLLPNVESKFINHGMLDKVKTASELWANYFHREYIRFMVRGLL